MNNSIKEIAKGNAVNILEVRHNTQVREETGKK